MKKYLLLFLILIVEADFLIAQTDSALIGGLVNNIEASQIKKNGAYYAGMFAGYRQCNGFPHNYQPDNHIFFTAITAFTLKNIALHLNNDSKAKKLYRSLKIQQLPTLTTEIKMPNPFSVFGQLVLVFYHIPIS